MYVSREDVDLFLAFSTGIGLAVAAGVRPLAAALVVGLCANADFLMHVNGTPYDFLANTVFVAAVAVVEAFALGVAAFAGDNESRFRSRIRRAGSVPATAVGAALFAAALADHGGFSWLGLAAGAVLAFGSWYVAYGILSGVGSRLEGESRLILAVLVDMSAAAAAFVALIAPPVSYVPAIVLAGLGVRRRRRAGRKYEGLRILR